MHSLLFVFEFLGTTELLVVAVVALILFGPRKLPEIGRTVGRGIAEFKRASDDFKRTWEYEVELEQRKPALEVPAAAQTTAHVAAEADGGAGVAADGGAGVAPPDGDVGAEGHAPPEYWGAPVARGSADEDADEDDGRRADAPVRRAGDDEINAS
jgi:sec-independent protein translocase protein TatA